MNTFVMLSLINPALLSLSHSSAHQSLAAVTGAVHLQQLRAEI